MRIARCAAFLWITGIAGCAQDSTGPDVASIEITSAAPSFLRIGQAVVLTAEVRTGGGQLVTDRRPTWSSSKPAIASVVATTGAVTGVAPGRAIIDASLLGRSDTMSILVVGPAATLSVSCASNRAPVDSSFTCVATVKDAAGTTLTDAVVAWSTTNATVATVTSQGVVTLRNGGASRVLASIGGILGGVDITADNPRPAIDSVTPLPIIVNPAGVNATVWGSGFVEATVVRCTGASRITSFVSRREVRAQLTPTDVGTEGELQCTTDNPAPAGGTSNSVRISIEPPTTPVPSLDDLQPDTLDVGQVGSTIDVAGRRFFRGAIVEVDGSARATTYVSDTLLRALLLSADVATGGIRQIRVRNPRGGFSVSRTLTVRNPVPGITSVALLSAAPNGTVTLKVAGTGFTALSRVRADGIELQILTTNSVEITCTGILPGVASGIVTNITVTNLPPGGGTSPNYRLAIEPPGIVPIGTINRGTLRSITDTIRFPFRPPPSGFVTTYFRGTSGNFLHNYRMIVVGPGAGGRGRLVSTNGQGTNLIDAARNTGRVLLHPDTVYNVVVWSSDPNDFNNSATLPFEFQVFPINLAPETAGAVLTPGIATNESLDPFGDIDTFSFVATAGRPVKLCLQGAVSGSLASASIVFSATLVGPGGQAVGSAVTSTGRDAGLALFPCTTPITLTQSGTYQVQVLAPDSHQDAGAYRLRVEH